MNVVNGRRVLIGALGATAAWMAWSIAVELGLLGSRYAEAQRASLLLETPRYPLFFFFWVLTLFLLSWVIAWLYANLRATQGPGPGTALKLGVLIGFVAGFPQALVQASWSPLDRTFPAAWAIEMWAGACLAALVAGWLYRPRGEEPESRSARRQCA